MSKPGIPDETLLIVGDDKIGRKLIGQLSDTRAVFLDRSSNLKRVTKLLKKRAVLPKDFIKMALAEFWRNDSPVSEPLPAITNNRELEEILDRVQPKRVLLFRAGLILSPKVIKRPIVFLNCHYCSVPEWGGLASLPRALRAGAFEQNACIHEVEAQIDTGEVVASKSYTLDPMRTYLYNENLASDAGVSLILDFLEGQHG